MTADLSKNVSFYSFDSVAYLVSKSEFLDFRYPDR